MNISEKMVWNTKIEMVNMDKISGINPLDYWDDEEISDAPLSTEEADKEIEDLKKEKCEGDDYLEKYKVEFAEKMKQQKILDLTTFDCYVRQPTVVKKKRKVKIKEFFDRIKIVIGWS